MESKEQVIEGANNQLSRPNNKNARVLWALIAHNDDYRVPAAA
jgi:hypothetical protein